MQPRCTQRWYSARIDPSAAPVGRVDFDVADFASAQDFLSQQGAARAGCLLLDLHMPVMSGIDLLEHMQTYGLRIPTIVITGRSDSILKDRALRLGAREMMDKPVTDEALLGAIGRALGTAG